MVNKKYINIFKNYFFKIWVKSAGLEKIAKKIAGYSHVPSGGFNVVLGVRKA